MNVDILKKGFLFMQNFKFISKSESDTKKFAKNLAYHLKPGDVIVLTGELGSRQNKIH